MRHKRFKFEILWRAFFYGLLINVFTAGHGFSQAPFYEGKTITVVSGNPAGGSGDLRNKAIISVLKKHIPGNPAIVMEYNMAGGGGRKAANHIYNVARPDGLTMGHVLSGTIGFAILGEPGVKYDMDRLIYLGSRASAAHFIFMTRKEAGLDNLEKLRSTPGVRLASRSVGASDHVIGRLFAYLLGMREPIFIPGYTGVEIDLALIRGEADATVSSGLDSHIRRNPDGWERLRDFHVGLEVPKGNTDPRLPTHLPDIESFARSDRERKLLALARNIRATGAPFILPPGTPKERVQILQEAMRKTFKDPEFYKEYQKLAGGEDPATLMPEGVEKVIKDLPREPDVINIFKKIAGGGPLPPR